MVSVRSVCATLTLSALSSATPVHADFQTALGEYNAGHYDVAHAQFLALAELGDCASQFNLGAMALKGQGGPKDAGSGVGRLGPQPCVEYARDDSEAGRVPRRQGVGRRSVRTAAARAARRAPISA